MTIQFVDAREFDPSRYKYEWEDISKELREHPGQWARITPEDASTEPRAAQATARRVRQGAVKSMPIGEFEATSRRHEVYARFIGKDGEYAG